jgi:DNA processing protein
MGGLSESPQRTVESVAPDVLLARAYLSRVAEPASIPVWAFVVRHGPVAAAALIRAGTTEPDVAAATEARRASADPDVDLEAAQRRGIRLVVPESADWPHFAFAALEAVGRRRLTGYAAGARSHHEGGESIPPLALWVRGTGDLGPTGVRSAAVVGARAATGYGEHVTAELSYGLARRGVTIVSGGAYGIDAAAHRGALAAGGETILVSAAGLDRPYPAGHTALYEQVAGSGLLISESPPGSAPHRGRFLTRNRLIAALSTTTIVVEAATRSGALNTARHATALGRPLLVVPGPITSAMSAGCHDLLRVEGGTAILVTSAADVLEIVGPVGGGEPGELDQPTRGDDDPLRRALDQLDPVARRVFDGLPARQPARADELARRSGVSPLDVIRALPALHLAGLVEDGDDGYRISATARRSRRRCHDP